MRVAVLTCRKLPNFVTWEIPDVDALFADDRLLMDAFAALGVAAEPVVWSDPTIDWDQFDVALIRSTWDYIDEREHFLSVLADIEASTCKLLNPLNAVRWNCDKSYLFDLQAWQVSIVPTLAASERSAAGLQAEAERRGWHRVILKPAVGAGASNVLLIRTDEITATVDRLAAQQPQQTYLLQPLIESVSTAGEWSFVFVAGAFSHALLKKPAPGDYRAHGIYGGSVAYAEPAQSDLQQAEAMLARLPFGLLYARLDLVRVENRPAVMELELIEPMMYFGLAPGTAGRLAQAVQAIGSRSGNHGR